MPEPNKTTPVNFDIQMAGLHRALKDMAEKLTHLAAQVEKMKPPLDWSPAFPVGRLPSDGGPQI